MLRPFLLPFLLLTLELPAQFLQIANGALPPSAAELLAYDAGRDRTVAFLGTSTWQHDGFTWSQAPTTNAPSDRYEYALTYDGERVLLYGGQSVSAGALADLWAFDGTTWTLLTNGQGPGLRRAAAMAYDAARDRVVLFGGTDMMGGFPADTWEWDGVSWTLAATAAAGPSQRVWHRMVYDEARQRTVMCGGAFNPVTFFDTWEWDGVSWVRTVVSTAPGGIIPGLVYDRSTQRVLQFGAFDPVLAFPLAEIHAYDPTTGDWDLVLGGLAFEQFLGTAYDSARERTLIVTQDPLFGPVQSFWYRDQGNGGATYTPFGQGCIGGGGLVPVLAAPPGSVPALGSTFTTVLGNAGNAVIGGLGIGWSRTQWNGVPLPASLAPAGFAGCDLLVAPEVLLPLAVVGGTATVTRTLPTAMSLRGVVFFEQALVLDASAPNGLGAVSNGCLAVVQ
jgi:hypothetical protein